MNKNDNIHTLSVILNGCLPYEYDQKLTDNETTLAITKEGSDLTMYVSTDVNNGDDFIVTYGRDDPTMGYYTTYETFRWTTEDEQIPLDTILKDIMSCL
jgi:hypothetical protein